MKTAYLFFCALLSACAYAPPPQMVLPAQDPMYGCSLAQRDLTTSWDQRPGDWCVTRERPVVHSNATRKTTNAELIDELL